MWAASPITLRAHKIWSERCLDMGCNLFGDAGLDIPLAKNLTVHPLETVTVSLETRLLHLAVGESQWTHEHRLLLCISTVLGFLVGRLVIRRRSQMMQSMWNGVVSAMIGACVAISVMSMYAPTCPTSWSLIPRSSTVHRGLILPNPIGLIDQGFRGAPMLTVFNPSSTDTVHIPAGDSIVQAVAPTHEPWTHVVITHSLKPWNTCPGAARGTDGLGSTGSRGNS